MKHDVDPVVTVVAFALLLIGGVVAAFIKSQKQSQEEDERTKRIYTKYGHTELGDRLAKRVMWTGETTEQLRDSFGPPLDIDEKVLKTKKREVWKYFRKGQNRYGLRVTIESGIVVGWDEKL
jgi:hypothetical protein